MKKDSLASTLQDAEVLVLNFEDWRRLEVSRIKSLSMTLRVIKDNYIMNRDMGERCHNRNSSMKKRPKYY